METVDQLNVFHFLVAMKQMMAVITMMSHILGGQDAAFNKTELVSKDRLSRRALSSGSRYKKGTKLPYSIERKLLIKYYACLVVREKYFKKHQEAYEAILVQEGQKLELKCYQCFRTSKSSEDSPIVWQRLKQAQTFLEPISPKERNFKLTEEKNLIIKVLDVSDTGQYFCIKNNKTEVKYQVDVRLEENYRLLDDTEVGNSLLAVQLERENLLVYTKWSAWTNCNQCGVVGERKKTGMCTVKKINAEKPIAPVDFHTYQLFVGGIPCRSTVLPAPVARVTEIKLRPSEIIIGKCYVPCPTTPATVIIKDINGEVLEVLKPGYYSIHDKPKLRKIVIHRVVYDFSGNPLILKCPTREMMIRWQNGTTPLSILSIRKISKGRVFIDVLNWLHVKKLQPTDTAAYSCWKYNRLIATIKVTVSTSAATDYTYRITLAGLAITGLSVFVICCCICRPKRTRAI